MGRKFILMLAVVSVVGGLAGGAMADIAQEFVPEGNYAGTNWQTSGPTETIAITLMLSEEPWMKEYGND